SASPASLANGIARIGCNGSPYIMPYWMRLDAKRFIDPSRRYRAPVFRIRFVVLCGERGGASQAGSRPGAAHRPG
ncbi:hypothetical protein, partial [Metallibacterium sp.]|uniref:hypothetical protein n=1 Tax=Metallibacterium sp. TaxID=2940281 RepID=UPI00262A5C9D